MTTLALVPSMKAYGSINPPEPVAVGPAFALEPRRWLMLAYLSTFALLSDWVCFFSAPIPELVVRTYSNDAFAVSNSHLVTVFLATNVLFCFLEPVVVRDARRRAPLVVVVGTEALALSPAPPSAQVRRAGLRAVVTGAGWLMAAGCGLRSVPSLARYRTLDAEWAPSTLS